MHAKHLLIATLGCFLATAMTAQNIGIGVDTPQTKLHVAGTLLTDSLRLPPGASDSYVLKSDAFGNAYWAPSISMSNPVLVNKVDVDWSPSRFDVQGDFAYVATSFADRLYVIDVSDPLSPLTVGEAFSKFGTYGLTAGQNAAFLGFHDTVYTYDVSDPTNPFVSGALFVNDGEHLVYENGYIYLISQEDNALYTIDAQTPNTLSVIDTAGIGGSPEKVVTDGGHAYIIDSDSDDLKIFDLTNPASPTLLGSVACGPSPNSVSAGNGHAYVTDAMTDSLYIFDVHDPASPLLVNTIGGVPASAGRVYNMLLLIADNFTDSIYFYRLTDPANPLKRGAALIPFVFDYIDVSEKYFYLLSNNGLEIFSLSQNLVTSELQGGMAILDGSFNGFLPGLMTIGSNDLMDHLQLHRSAVGGVHLTATDPLGMLVASDAGVPLLFADATDGSIGIGTQNTGDLLPGPLPSTVKLDVREGHINLSGNYGVLTTNQDSTGFGAGFDTSPDDGLDLWAGGASRIRIDTNGKVGIGTSAPGSVITNALLEVNGGHIALANNFGIFSHNSGGTGIGAGFDSGTNDELALFAGGTTRLHIQADGKAGIGTTSPDHDLTIFDTQNDGDAVLNIQDSDQEIFLGVNNSGGTLRTITNDDLSFWTNNVQHVTIKTDGKIGIGTLTPGSAISNASLEVTDGHVAVSTNFGFFSNHSSGTGVGAGIDTDSNDHLHLFAGGTSQMSVLSSGFVGIGTTSPTALLEVNAFTVKKTAGGSWTASSDIRLKQDIRDFQSGLHDVLRIRPVKFRYNTLSGYDTQQEHVGVIAQELQEIAPYMVSTFEKDGTEYLEVDNSAMIYMLVNAVKELSAQNASLQEQVTVLKSMIEGSNHHIRE